MSTSTNSANHHHHHGGHPHHNHNHPAPHPLITLENLIGDTSHIVCEESTLVVSGLNVQTWIYYNPKVQQKPPIIVIHGGPGFTHNYLLPLKLLAEFGYPLIFYDQAGYVLSPYHVSFSHITPPPPPPRCGQSTFVNDPINDAPWLLTIDYYVQELSALIHHFQLYEYYLYGSSWGTVVAQEFAVSITSTTDAQLRGLQGLILDGALSDGQLYIQTQWRDRISTLPMFTQNLLKKLMNAKAYDSPLYQEIESVLSSHFTIRCVPRPDIFLKCVKQMNRAVYHEIQGPSEFALSGVLENWSITDRLWKIKGRHFLFTLSRLV
jgi:pimeloyl-ACP methyl ester carboxylesterase